MGDVVGRTLRGAGRLDLVGKTFDYVDPSSIVTLSPTFSLEQAKAAPIIGHFPATEFDPRPGNLRLLLGTGGVKFNPFGNLLISASVLFPLTNAAFGAA